MNADPLQNLQVVANQFEIAKSSVKSILNENKIGYYKRTPVSPLTPFHKNRCFNICRQANSIPPQNLLPIIFTNESTVFMDWKEVEFGQKEDSTLPNHFMRKSKELYI